jgi:hypothetical protein
VLNELPTTLEDTYERTLQGIPKEKQQHAHRLFQCLVVAIRPLRVEELAEIFAIEFEDSAPTLVEDWRPENPEEAVLSACSTLISIIDHESSKIAQFSHFSVKEFLISDRFRTSELASIRHYHIPLHEAHTLLARTCLTILLQLDEKIDKNRLSKFPLAFYAAQYWVDHARFEDVESRIEDAIKQLFDPRSPHLAAWIWIHNIEWEHKQTINSLEERLSPPEATSLYYAACCGLAGIAKHLIVAHQEDVNVGRGRFEPSLHVASYKGHLEVARLLLDHGADVNSSHRGEILLRRVYRGGRLEVMRLVLERGADVDKRDNYFGGTVLHQASLDGQAEAVQLLLQHKADVNAKGYLNQTPLRLVYNDKNVEVAKILLEYGADIHAKSDSGVSPLEAAKLNKRHKLLESMLKHNDERE